MEFFSIIKKHRIKLFLIVLLILILSLILIKIKNDYPRIKLNKGSNITINYKEEYKEPGYKLIINNKDYTKSVKVKGKVNNNKLGSYKIVYSYKKGVFNIYKERIVNVVDKTKPVITISGSKKTYICPNTEYKEEGYQAIDNYDGDITKKVRIDEKNNAIIYTAVDSHNNKSILTRNLIYEDIVKPTIALNGGSNVRVFLGNSYSDLGFSATDNCDGDITDKVVVNGEVNTNKIGTYVIKYSVSDSNNNTVEIERVVNVVEKPRGVIYLTFDDGPNEGTTNVILDILKEEGVVATFFVTNSGPDYLIKREFDENHTVALHTSSHNYALVYASDDAFFEDLYSVRDRVKRITGIESNIIRFPGGSSNTISRRYSVGIMSRLTQEVLNRGFKYYDWNISSGDAGATTDPNGVYQNVVNNLRYDRVNMVLLHDIKSYTRDAIRNIIRYGKENGYTFMKIDENTEMITQRVNN